MRIKEEYKGKTIVKHATVRNITVVVDNIDVSKYKYYVSIGMGYLFEDESETTTAPEQCIKYEGIEQEVEQTTISDAKSKTKRTKRRVSPKVHGGLGESE
jgi:hypothetical protein